MDDAIRSAEKLVRILTLVGEFPMASLGLLGSVRSYGDLIRKPTTVQEFRLPDSNARIQCRLLTVSGKGKRKTLRFFRGGLPLVERWDKERYRQYLREYRDHSFSGNSSHIERNHLIAEAAVMHMGAGIQAGRYVLKYRIICFPEQVPFLKSYLGNDVSYATANMAKVEKVLGIQAVNYLGS